MKKIVFPTDFSKVATNAFIYALELAKQYHAEIILLHTYELPIVDYQFASQNYKTLFDSLELINFDRFKEEAAKLKEIIAKHKAEKVRLSHALRDGDLVFNLKELIREEQADFVVMGTAGASGWSEYFLGTNTTEAISNLNVPVLSVPKEASFTGIETIAFTTRFREKDKKALQEIIHLAKGLQAKVKCLYVETRDTDNTPATYEDWKSHFKLEPVQFYIIPNDDVEATITDFISGNTVDVLAMMTYKKGFFAHLFAQSFTEKMANHLSIPVLALHE